MQLFVRTIGGVPVKGGVPSTAVYRQRLISTKSFESKIFGPFILSVSTVLLKPGIANWHISN
jgi:hypothetical protein